MNNLKEFIGKEIKTLEGVLEGTDDFINGFNLGLLTAYKRVLLSLKDESLPNVPEQPEWEASIR